MGLKVKIAKISDKPYISSLLQLYLRELSEFEEISFTPSGEYEYDYLEFYWTEKNRRPYLFYFDGKTADFALVWQNEEQIIMAEFTVLPEYRGYRFGSIFADEVIQRHHGKWNIEYSIKNSHALEFWNKLVKNIKVSNLKKEKINEDRESLIFTYSKR